MLRNEVFTNENDLSWSFGSQGFPTAFMTDDCVKERNALKQIWSHSQRFLCLFHVPQAIWRWLFDNEHHIDNRYKL
jgi:hypothetical protein